MRRYLLLGIISIFIAQGINIQTASAGSCLCDTRYSATKIAPSCLKDKTECSISWTMATTLSNCVYFETPNCDIAENGNSNQIQSVLDQTTVSLTKPIDELAEPPVHMISIPFIKYTPISKEYALDSDNYIYIPWLAEYFAGVYQYILSVISIVAVIIIIFYGVLIVISAGGEQKNQAYKKIWNTLIGLFIAWSSYAILYTINPDLVKFKALKMKYVVGENIPEAMLIDNNILPSDLSYDLESGNTASNGTKVPYYNQTDKAWLKCGGGDRVAAGGCGITSVAMVLKYYGVDVNPCHIFQSNKFSVYMNWENFLTFGTKGVKMGYFETADKDVVKRCLANSIPVMIYTTNPNFTSKYHFMVLTRYENGTFYLNDPGHNKKTMTEAEAFSPWPPKPCNQIYPNCAENRPFPSFRVLYNTATHTKDCNKI